MILSDEQKSNIRVLVSNEVKYHETYQEVYDHMLAALEARESLPDLQKAYADTLEQDFGGHRGIEKLEGRQRATIRQDMKQKRWQYFAWFFKFPGIIFPLVYCVICYYGFEFYQKGFELKIILGIVVMMFLPSVFISIGNFVIGYKTGKVKPSFNSFISNIITENISRLFVFSAIVSDLFSFIHFNFPFKPDHAATALVNHISIYIIFLIMCLYNVAIFKVYRIEFKKRLAI